MSTSSEPCNVTRRPDGTGPSIGLCLSGGGFRAALFALGVMRYLAEAGQLGNVRAVSAVSGGSVAAAVTADRWPELQAAGFTADAFEEHVSGPFLDTITGKNLRNRGAARWVLTRVAPKRRRLGSSLGVTMAKHLLRAQRVADLPDGLQVILTSTDLASGRAFRVSQGFIGGWEFGYSATPPTLSLSLAIAASTAVPFLFPPVHVRTAGLGLADAPPELSLVDGGVYDNLGLEWFQGWNRGRPDGARECEFIVAVDASSPLRTSLRRFGWGRSLFRSQGAQYAQTRASRVRWFVDQLMSGRMEGLLVQINKEPARFEPPPGVDIMAGAADGALSEGFADALTRLRTDLDRFLPKEAELLMYHGYWSTHVRLRHLRPDLAVRMPRWRQYADLSEGAVAELHAILAAGERRSLRRH
jgi:NTE family protein